MPSTARLVSVSRSSTPPLTDHATDCQRLDWKLHKLVCKSFHDVKPSENHRLVLFFPAADTVPHLVWVPVQSNDQCQVIDKALIDLEDESVRMKEDVRNLLQGRWVGRDSDERLQIIMKEEKHGDAVNQAVQNVTRTGVAAKTWRGPLCVAVIAGRNGRFEHYRDVEPRDVRSAADFFSIAYRSDEASCAGYEIETLIKKPSMASSAEYTQNISPDNVSEWTWGGSCITNLLGMPMLVCGYGVFKEKDDSVSSSSRLGRRAVSCSC